MWLQHSHRFRCCGPPSLAAFIFHSCSNYIVDHQQRCPLSLFSSPLSLFLLPLSPPLPPLHLLLCLPLLLPGINFPAWFLLLPRVASLIFAQFCLTDSDTSSAPPLPSLSYFLCLSLRFCLACLLCCPPLHPCHINALRLPQSPHNPFNF